MSTIKKDSKSESFEDDSENKEEKELGEYINHAGRLLLNHGYIKDAIKTENKTFLDNSTVKGILNEMWYGTEKLDTRTVSLRMIIITMDYYSFFIIHSLL